MKDILANELFVKIMGWDRERISTELPFLQVVAEYKYDEYHQFAAGTRFIESLALWLRQFSTSEEREVAYRFVLDDLIFLSSSEMQHFVEMAYPDHIRPKLLRRAAIESGQNPNHTARIAASIAFRELERKCLFLGLSDGARIDLFRRSNTNLSHEQIWLTYELSKDRVDEMTKELNQDLTHMHKRSIDNARFSTIVLLDDFSASGRSYYMPSEGKRLGGKIAEFYHKLTDTSDPLSKLAADDGLSIIVLLYVATAQAREHIAEHSNELWKSNGVECGMEVVQLLPDWLRLTRGGQSQMNRLIEEYYDPLIHDRHLKKGDTEDSRYGFADCGLPLVLHHNTPNNSISLLWSYEEMTVRGLFPRVRRHKERS